MKQLALIPIALIASAAFAAKPHVYKGWVSDAKCGAKGASAAHKDCAVTCLKGGSAYVFITGKDNKIYTVDNPTALKGDEGLFVQVSGTITDTKIHITGVKKLAQPAATTQSGEHN